MDEPAGRAGQQASDVGHRCLLAVHDAEAIRDVEIGKTREFSSECGALLRILARFPGIETYVLKEDDIAGRHRANERARLRTGDVGAQRYRSIEKFAQACSHRRKAQRRVWLTLGPAEVGNHDDLCSGPAQVAQGRQAGLDASIVGDDPSAVRSVTEGHIEVGADDNDPPRHIKVIKRLHGDAYSFEPTRPTRSTRRLL